MNMEDREHTLYLITTASGGTYIGCTKQFEKRKNNHRALANRGKPLQKVHQAIKACGGEFEMAVLRTGSKERMLRLEERAIGILKPSLNVLIGHKHPSETRAAMGLTNKGRKLSTETKRKMSLARTGNKLTAETKAKISLAAMGNQRGLNPSAETRAKMSSAQTGREHSDETKAKMSRAAQGREVSEEARVAVSRAQTGNQHRLGARHTAESRMKMSLAQKARQAKVRIAREGGAPFATQIAPQPKPKRGWYYGNT